MANWQKTAALMLAAPAFAFAAPASASIFEYEMTNGDLLTINTITQSGTWKGHSIDVSFTSPDFANFTGGAKPNFVGMLTSLDGTRIVKGKVVTDNLFNGNRTHPQKLKSMGDGKFNLWAWWGDPVVSGDYIKKIKKFGVTHPVDVPAPGALGLFGLALCAIGLGRRRRRAGATAG